MEVRSLAGLTQLVDRVEELATELRELSATDSEVQLPEVPLHLSLESIEEWLTAVEECRRKPLLARSKRLLEGHGVDTASIPAVVLESSDVIGGLVQKILGFPTPIQSA